MSLMPVIPHGQHVTGTQQISVAWINEQSFWQLSVPCNLSLFLSNLGNPLVCLMDSLDLISFYLQSVVIPKFLPRCSLKGSSLAGDSAWRLILKLCLHSTLSMTEKMPTVHIQGNRMMEKWGKTTVLPSDPPALPEDQVNQLDHRNVVSILDLTPLLYSSPTHIPSIMYTSCLALSVSLETRIPEPLQWPPVTPASWQSRSWMGSLPYWLWSWPQVLLWFRPMEHWQTRGRQRLDEHSHFGGWSPWNAPFGDPCVI